MRQKRKKTPTKYIERVKTYIKPKPNNEENTIIKNSSQTISKIKSKKTVAKMMGIKSVSTINGKIVVSSFKNINDNDILFISDHNGSNIEKESPLSYKINIDNKHNDVLSFVKNNYHSSSPNPIKNDIANLDYLKQKSELEIEFFREEYPNDNIRMQIINNILDIDKTYSEVVNNIVFIIQNISQEQDKEHNHYVDYLGEFPQNSSFEEYGFDKDGVLDAKKLENCKFFLRKLFMSTQNYNNIFTNDIEHNYYIIQILSIIRNHTAHYSQRTRRNSCIYSKENINIFSDKLVQIYKKQLDNNSISIKEKFVANLSRDIYILSKIFPDKPRKELLKDLYNFSILKTYKALLISIKKIREVIIEKLYYMYFTEADFIRSRRKINKIVDFIIVEKLSNKDDILVSLREIKKEKKSEFYYELGKNILNDNANIFKFVYLRVVESIRIEPNLPDVVSADLHFLNNEFPFVNYSNFSYIISFLCNFISPKEINDFINHLISKFQNIAGLFKLLNELSKSEVNINKNYSIFLDSGSIAKELSNILLIRLRKEHPSIISNELYQSAVELFGVGTDANGNPKDLSQYLYNVPYHKQGDNSIRNFLYKNVFNMSLFQYVSNYYNPKDASMFIKNISLVKMVLKKLPETQILKYCTSLSYYEEGLSIEKQIHRVAQAIIRFNIDKIDRTDLNNEKEKRDLLIFISAYLNILYIIVKQLIKANTRYFIAYETLEKDLFFSSVRQSQDPLSLLKYYINDDKKLWKNKVSEYKKHYHYKSKWIEILSSNIKETTEYMDDYNDIFLLNRANIAHLSIIKNSAKYVSDFNRQGDTDVSFFELYHYLAQRLLVDSFKNTKYINELDISLKKYSMPSKDVIKLLYLPFAYNLPRYKNLTIKECYMDDNNDDEK